MSRHLKDRIKNIEQLTEEIYRLTVESGAVSGSARPGQFVNVKCCEGSQALLRRPISICTVDRENGCYELLFQKKGGGTGLLTHKKPGDELDVLGPLGNGFDLNAQFGRIAVVGGGIGIFPLLFLLNESRANMKRAYLGFRTKGLVVLEDAFRESASVLEIATDDGSYGTAGYVTDMLKRDIEAERLDMIYACGPAPMLKRVAATANAAGIRCQVALEQRMGCGFGACLVCACKTRAEGAGDAESEGWQYSHVCTDGPVFDSRDILFDE